MEQSNSDFRKQCVRCAAEFVVMYKRRRQTPLCPGCRKLKEAAVTEQLSRHG